MDDSEARAKIFSSALASSELSDIVQVVYCESADQARVELLAVTNLLVLDILLPKKIGGIPQAKNSINLLNDICDPKKRYIRPKLIIGLTADVAEMRGYATQFEQEASVVLDGTLTSNEWVERILTQIEKLMGAERKSFQDRDSTLITVHGIRTHGHWQTKITDEVGKHNRNVESVEIKYGFFDLLSFAVPFLRKRTVRAAAKRILRHIDASIDREIYIVAHSFGTLIAVEAVATLPQNRVGCLILCGSPLSSGFNLDPVVEASKLTVNDCGTRDLILILSRLFIWGLGDAGRVGFVRENTDDFCNRYFSGGHDLYFKPYLRLNLFYRRFWLNLFYPGGRPERFDDRTSFLGEDLIDALLKLLDFVKPILCLIPFALLIAPVYFLLIWLVT
ncbi:alpha/beta hydrolase [Massilia sp. Dwa41.01b]|uniref:alpha/beta fold hydrolase n=1 Tax=unclassified Massilia TaxID=2609279 RepID=UPI0016000192|nr:MULTISPECIES: alpha/beta hydrolase [unclassified Massilia]QNA89312.1 alpha/beta hydrolase [Massilia sp. Dwa41.01b]QNB00211.1 alpha/beta hydrolase [Massilia sp. Se16.2.3]